LVFCGQSWSDEERVTPDGIATADWDRVHQLALDVVNASSGDDPAASESAKLLLCDLLDQLQEKYGPLPSLLATRADYVDGLDEQEYWLMAAYEQAMKLGDPKNLVWIASSLAGFHLEEATDPVKGSEWLALLEQHLRASPDASEADEAVRLRGILERLKEGPQNNQMQRTRSARATRRGPRR
jgi:hypothetical protein